MVTTQKKLYSRFSGSYHKANSKILFRPADITWVLSLRRSIAPDDVGFRHHNCFPRSKWKLKDHVHIVIACITAVILLNVARLVMTCRTRSVSLNGRRTKPQKQTARQSGRKVSRLEPLPPRIAHSIQFRGGITPAMIRHFLGAADFRSNKFWLSNHNLHDLPGYARENKFKVTYGRISSDLHYQTGSIGCSRGHHAYRESWG